MGGKAAGSNMKATTTAPAPAPKPVVTNPEVARRITEACVIFSLMEIVMFAYVTYLHFRIDGPLWEAFAWSGVEALLFLLPVCFMPMIRAKFISVFAEEPSDLSSNLLAHENV